MKTYPSLLNSFSKDFIEKYVSIKLTVEDLIGLTKKQLNILKKVDVTQNIYFRDIKIVDTIGITKAIKLFLYSKEEYELVRSFITNNTKSRYYLYDNEVDLIKNFEIDIKKANTKKMKSICFSYAREILLKSTANITPENYPEEFVKENEDIFLTKIDMNHDFLRYRYEEKALTCEDIFNNPEIFKNEKIPYFVSNNEDLKYIVINLGPDNFYKILFKYFDFFLSLEKSNFLYCCEDYFNYHYNNCEKNFIYAIKSFWIEKQNYFLTIPDWFKDFNFKEIKEYESWEEMKEYDDYVIINSSEQRAIIEFLGIENLKRFDEETNYFSNNIISFEKKIASLYFFLYRTDEGRKFVNHIGDVEYNEFFKVFSKYLEYALIEDYFNSEDNYNFIKGRFRINNPQIFIDENAPEELKNAFYDNEIDYDFLYEHPEYHSYFLDKDLSIFLGGNDITIINYSNIEKRNVNFINFYTKKFGNAKMLNLISKYGRLLEYIYFNISINASEKEIEKIIEDYIYNNVCYNSYTYHDIMSKIPDFVAKHPDIFLDLNGVNSIPEKEKESIVYSFYFRQFSYEIIREYPELVNILLSKNLLMGFNNRKGFINCLENNVVDKETFLKACAKYGKLLTCIDSKDLLEELENNKKDSLEFDELCIIIEKIIAKTCLLGEIKYYEENYNPPEFLKNDYPELYLSEDAPENLKRFFYHDLFPFIKVQFKFLKKFPEWLPYLENKSIVTPFLRSKDKEEKKAIKKYFDLFSDKAIKIGIQKSETVEKMIEANAVETMKKWYDATGQKFIPHYVVMQNFPVEDIGKYLNAIPYWNRLMKIEHYTKRDEHKEALLKLAYSFGVFHNDDAGFQKLYNLLTYVPHFLSKEQAYIIRLSDNNLGECDYNIINNLIEENYVIKNKTNILNQLYRKNKDGSYTLTINPQRYPKSMQALRKYLEVFSDKPIMTPDRMHQLFGGFKMYYDKDFRKFLLANLENINEDNITYISSIQRQFKEIKAMNSNRILTLDLAINFVQQNKYENINPGNERMAEISSIAGYSQYDFEILQKIYNYGRMRIFSSIPRISNKNEKYNYEILRLDDPLALAIGTLSDCCQEIHNVAEVCMEHSMVDENGRVFVIKDNKGNIVSQSWVWRNKNVLCFDNIEIPDKAFKRTDLNKECFAKEVYDIYKQASKELIEEDEKVYKELLNSEKISQEQYDGLVLRKVTVGLGYNDIANAIKKNASAEIEECIRPIPYTTKILKRTLYTSDSLKQYILEEKDNVNKYNGNTLSVHNDKYIIYDESNITANVLNILFKMKINCKEYNDLELKDLNNIFSTIAEEYDLIQETTKILIHTNFIIIFDEYENTIRIGEILYLFSIDGFDMKESVTYQIKLALKQISNDKKIDISKLDDNESEVLENIINISNDELDIKKGLKREKK